MVALKNSINYEILKTNQPDCSSTWKLEINSQKLMFVPFITFQKEADTDTSKRTWKNELHTLGKQKLCWNADTTSFKKQSEAPSVVNKGFSNI